MIYFPHPWVTGTKRETSLSTSRRNTSTVAEKVGALLSKRRETCRRYTTTSETRTINECQFTTALLVAASIIERRKNYHRVPVSQLRFSSLRPQAHVQTTSERKTTSTSTKDDVNVNRRKKVLLFSPTRHRSITPTLQQ